MHACAAGQAPLPPVVHTGRVNQRWLICVVGEQLVGINADNVREVSPLARVAPIPRAPSHVRGVMLLRGNGLPLVDLRVLLGMEGRQVQRERLRAAITARRADHVAWLRQLEESILQDKPFTLATDPTRCAFGRWYATFKADDAVLGVALVAFEQPHRQIHRLAVDAFQLASAGRRDDAVELVQRASTGELKTLLDHFDRVLPMLQAPVSETVVVVTVGNSRFGVCVDEAVELWTSPGHPQAQGDTGEAAGPVLGILRQGARSIVALDCARLGHAGCPDGAA